MTSKTFKVKHEGQVMITHIWCKVLSSHLRQLFAEPADKETEATRHCLNEGVTHNISSLESFVASLALRMKNDKNSRVKTENKETESSLLTHIHGVIPPDSSSGRLLSSPPWDSLHVFRAFAEVIRHPASEDVDDMRLGQPYENIQTRVTVNSLREYGPAAITQRPHTLQERSLTVTYTLIISHMICPRQYSPTLLDIAGLQLHQ